MRISVNLATRPFVELQPFFLRMRLIMAAMVVVALALGITGHVLAAKLHLAQEQMAALHNGIVGADQEKNRNERQMRAPENAAVLERAHFLNDIFLRKSFSWTAVMMDLENVLPVGVQVTSIEPQVSPEGDVTIRLRVSGERDRAVQLVRNLERSRRFLQPRLAGEAAQARETAAGPGAAAAAAPQGPAGVEFDILARYNPLPANEPYRFTRAPRAARVAEIEPTASVPAGAGERPRYPRYGVVLPPHASPGTSAQGGTR